MTKLSVYRLLLLLLACSPATIFCAEAGSGPVYSVVELTFNGPSFGPSDAPAKDVDFWARFQHESGSPSYQIHGFWDSDGQGGTRGNLFKIRFCPTKTGRWNIVEVSSNRNELKGQKQGDHITVTSSNLHGFWEVDTSSPGNRWYKRSDGSHQYVVGNTMYSFLSETYNGRPNGEIAKDVRGNAGYFKKIRFSAVGDLYPHPQDRPFLSSSGSPTLSGNDSHRPNPEWFTKRLDLAVKTAFEDDLIADIIMAGVDTSDARRSLTPSGNGGDAGPYLKYLVARYGSYPNVWFCVVNEFDHTSRSPNFSASQMKNYGAKIKSYMAYPSPLSVHHRTNWQTDLNSDPPWNDHVIFQDKIKQMGESASAIKRNYSAGGSNKPVVNDELSYQQVMATAKVTQSSPILEPSSVVVMEQLAGRQLTNRATTLPAILVLQPIHRQIICSG
jgi:hypothetical protein